MLQALSADELAAAPRSRDRGSRGRGRSSLSAAARGITGEILMVDSGFHAMGGARIHNYEETIYKENNILGRFVNCQLPL